MSIRDDIIRIAATYVGKPYGLPPGPGQLDCSSYVEKVYTQVGIPFKSRTAEQLRQECIPIGWNEVLPGDLLFAENTYNITEAKGPDGHVASHVMISLGAGTGQAWSAQEPAVKLANINTPYWQDHLFAAGRSPKLTSTVPVNNLEERVSAIEAWIRSFR